MRRVLLLAAAALLAASCATAPKQTLAELNRRDPEYRSRDCRQARREAAGFDDERNGRMVAAMAANLVVPLSGVAAGAVMGKVKDDRKRELNHRLRGACTSDPLARRR